MEALQLHPNCWYLHTTAARALMMLGDYAEALRHLRLAKLLCPEPDFDLNSREPVRVSFNVRGNFEPPFPATETSEAGSD